MDTFKVKYSRYKSLVHLQQPPYQVLSLLVEDLVKELTLLASIWSHIFVREWRLHSQSVRYDYFSLETFL